jgi:hypothetical protein
VKKYVLRLRISSRGCPVVVIDAVAPGMGEVAARFGSGLIIIAENRELKTSSESQVVF